MSRTIRLRPRARADFGAIWRYTTKQWDAVQADTYTGEMEAAFRRIADNPVLGSDQSSLYRGLRKIAAGSHLVYYLFDDESIDIVRILHNRMDVTTGL